MATRRRRKHRDHAEVIRGTHGGKHRRDRAHNRSDEAGLRVVLRRRDGLTKKGHLTVPYFFQVPPMESIGWEEAHDHAEYQTLRAGTFSRSAGRGLAVVNFSTLVVDWDQDAARESGPVIPRKSFTWRDNTFGMDPFWLTDELRSLMRTGTPFELRVGMPQYREEWDIKMLATLRNMRVEERAGEPEARYVDVSFSEYRSQDRLARKGRRARRGDRVVVLQRLKDGGTRVDAGTLQGIANHQKQTLHRIARVAYGEASEWKFLARHNGIKKWSGDDDLFDYMERRKLRKLRVEVPPERRGDSAQSSGARDDEDDDD